MYFGEGGSGYSSTGRRNAEDMRNSWWIAEWRWRWNGGERVYDRLREEWQSKKGICLWACGELHFIQDGRYLTREQWTSILLPHNFWDLVTSSHFWVRLSTLSSKEWIHPEKIEKERWSILIVDKSKNISIPRLASHSKNRSWLNYEKIYSDSSKNRDPRNNKFLILKNLLENFQLYLPDFTRKSANKN